MVDRRDGLAAGALPASRALRTVDRRGAPIGATIATALIACGGLLFGLHSAAVGTAAIYVAFLLIALAALPCGERRAAVGRGVLVMQERERHMCRLADRPLPGIRGRP